MVKTQSARATRWKVIAFASAGAAATVFAIQAVGLASGWLSGSLLSTLILLAPAGVAGYAWKRASRQRPRQGPS